MDDQDDIDAALAHQQELESRQIEEAWQAMCATCHRAFTAQIEALTSQRKETKDHELECF